MLSRHVTGAPCCPVTLQEHRAIPSRYRSTVLSRHVTGAPFCCPVMLLELCAAVPSCYWSSVLYCNVTRAPCCPITFLEHVTRAPCCPVTLLEIRAVDTTAQKHGIYSGFCEMRNTFKILMFKKYKAIYMPRHAHTVTLL